MPPSKVTQGDKEKEIHERGERKEMEESQAYKSQLDRGPNAWEKDEMDQRTICVRISRIKVDKIKSHYFRSKLRKDNQN